MNGYALEEILGYGALDAVAHRVLVGMIDVGATARDLREMGPLTVAQARVLLATAVKIIQVAITSGGAADLPGEGKRAEVLWKLRWHLDALAKNLDGNARYGGGEDLKKWVQQAVVELNATEEGRRYRQQIWDDMIAEIRARAVATAEGAGKALETAGKAATAPIAALSWISQHPFLTAGIVGAVLLVGGGAVFVALVKR